MSDPKDRPGKLSPGIAEAAQSALRKAGEEAEKESNRTYARLSCDEASDRFLKQAKENLRQAAREARQREEQESRYERLSKEEWDAVVDDLKEHLRVTEKYRRYEKLVNALMESVPKNPTIH
ncbi:MAG TPA: hypothetical protein VND65_05850 [Candidatus Binatia bacterium]|nr:hypothetical protein [Candidatus Binatia bacterium]